MLTAYSIDNSKLFMLLRSLNKKELKQLELWLASPFLNNSEKALNLYKGILHKHKKLDAPISKSQMLNYIGIEVDFDESSIHPKKDLTLRQTLSALTGQVQAFLVWQKTKEDKFSEKRRLMDALIERKLYKLVPAILKKTKKELESCPYRNVEYYENSFHITEMEFYLNIILNNRNKKIDIQQVIDGLWEIHLGKILQYYCAARNREKIVQSSYKYPLLPSIKEYIQQNQEQDIPVIKVYYILLNLIEEEDDTNFYQLKKYVFEKIQVFDIILIRQFLNHLTNYCTRAIRIGKDEFIQERQDIYELGLELDCWSAGVYFSTHQFLHIARNAIWLNRIQWADNFVEKYQSTLNPAIRHDIVNYYSAIKTFQIGDFDTAQDYLIKIDNTEDFVYHIEYKILLIKIYYEQQPLTIDNMDIHPINYELESIRHYIMSTRNKKMSETLRTSYNNFVNLLKRIINRKKKMLWNEKVKGSTNKLMQELLSESPFTERQWLKEKVKQLQQEELSLG